MKLYKPICLTAFVSLFSLNELNAEELQTSLSKAERLNKTLVDQVLLNQALKSELSSDLSDVQASIIDELTYNISTNVSESLNNMKDDVFYMNANYENALVANQGAH